MIMTITLIITFLVALNFILLFTSCNKTTKRPISEKPQILKKESPATVTKQLPSAHLAPTGS